MAKFAFIVNPISGGKKKDRIASLIRKNMAGTGLQWQIEYTEYSGHATRIARDSDADIVVAVGGDGTVSEVAQGIAMSGKTLGIIPCGSGDGLALHLGISRRPAKAIKQILSGTKVRIDCCTVNGRPFFCTTGAGFDAEVALAFSRAGKRGLKTYITCSWDIWRHYEPQKYNIRIDGTSTELKAMFITAGNANQWGNSALIAPEASVKDGMIDLTVVKPFHIWQFPVLVWRLFRGTANRSRKVVHLRGSQIDIHRPSEGAMHCDGDPVVMGESLQIRIQPAALSVLVPKGQPDKI